MFRLVVMLGLLVPAAGAQGTGGPPDERVAERLLEQARHAVASGKMRKAWNLITRLRGPLESTRTVSEAGAELERLRLLAGLEVVGAGAGLHGRVEPLEEGRLRLVYEAGRKPRLLEDFKAVPTVPDIRGLKRKDDRISGTGAFCHRAHFAGDLSIQVEGTPVGSHDFGLVVVDPDAEESRFLVGALNNTFFGVKYGKSRRVTPGHNLVFCGRGAESLARYKRTQILSRMEKPTVERGSSLRLSLSWRQERVQLAIGEASVHVRLAVPQQDMARKQAGIHLHRSSFRVQRVVLEGRLDPAWSRKEEKRLRDSLR